MERSNTVDGYEFEWDKENDMYSCRGEMCYDDEHDEIPEERLWSAAHKLRDELKSKGFESEVTHSEKGWVEVQVENPTDD